MKIVKTLSTELRSALAADGTSIAVQKFVDSDGNEVTLSDFGGSYLRVVVKQGSKIEIIQCDGITQSATDDTATLSIATSGRNILPKPPYTGSSTGKAFQTGAELIVTNDPATMNEIAWLPENNTFSGANTFTQFPKKSGSTTPVDDEDFVTLAHLNSVVLGDATVSAIKSSVTFGEAVTAGNPVYFKSSDQKWWRAYANDAATCVGVKLGIVQEDAAADATGVITRFGRDAVLTGLTAGSKHYLTDAGGVSTTAGSNIVELGVATSTTSLIFDPKDGKREQYLSTLTGMIVPFAGDSVPSGFLACDGALYTFATHTDLFAVIGTKYGIGSGTAFTVTAATNTIDLTSHGLSNGTRLRLTSSTTLPAGLAVETDYYIVEAATNTFKLALTAGGAAVDITDTGTGTHRFHTQFKVPDLRGSVVIGKGQKAQEIKFLSDELSLVSGNTVTDTDASGDLVALGLGVATGDAIIFDNGGVGIAADTVYYVHDVSSSWSTLHTTRAAALAGSSPINITADSGSGYVWKKAVTITATAPIDQFTNGMEVTLSTDGTLPTGLSAGTYYVIKVSDTTFQLAATYSDALNGVGALPINDVGSGTHTITFNLTNRSLGDFGGAETHQLIEAELASHSHNLEIDNTGSGTGGLTNGDAGVFQSDYVQDAGGDEPHNNMQPFVVINYVIKT